MSGANNSSVVSSLEEAYEKLEETLVIPTGVSIENANISIAEFTVPSYEGCKEEPNEEDPFVVRTRYIQNSDGSTCPSRRVESINGAINITYKPFDSYLKALGKTEDGNQIYQRLYTDSTYDKEKKQNTGGPLTKGAVTDLTDIQIDFDVKFSTQEDYGSGLYNMVFPININNDEKDKVDNNSPYPDWWWRKTEKEEDLTHTYSLPLRGSHKAVVGDVTIHTHSQHYYVSGGKRIEAELKGVCVKDDNGQVVSPKGDGVWGFNPPDGRFEAKAREQADGSLTYRLFEGDEIRECDCFAIGDVILTLTKDASNKVNGHKFYKYVLDEEDEKFRTFVEVSEEYDAQRLLRPKGDISLTRRITVHQKLLLCVTSGNNDSTEFKYIPFKVKDGEVTKDVVIESVFTDEVIIPCEPEVSFLTCAISEDEALTAFYMKYPFRPDGEPVCDTKVKFKVVTIAGGLTNYDPYLITLESVESGGACYSSSFSPKISSWDKLPSRTGYAETNTLRKLTNYVHSTYFNGPQLAQDADSIKEYNSIKSHIITYNINSNTNQCYYIEYVREDCPEVIFRTDWYRLDSKVPNIILSVDRIGANDVYLKLHQKESEPSSKRRFWELSAKVCRHPVGNFSIEYSSGTSSTTTPVVTDLGTLKGFLDEYSGTAFDFLSVTGPEPPDGTNGTENSVIDEHTYNFHTSDNSAYEPWYDTKLKTTVSVSADHKVTFEDSIRYRTMSEGYENKPLIADGKIIFEDRDNFWIYGKCGVVPSYVNTEWNTYKAGQKNVGITADNFKDCDSTALNEPIEGGELPSDGYGYWFGFHTESLYIMEDGERKYRYYISAPFPKSKSFSYPIRPELFLSATNLITGAGVIPKNIRLNANGNPLYDEEDTGSPIFVSPGVMVYDNKIEKWCGCDVYRYDGEKWEQIEPFIYNDGKWSASLSYK